MGRTASPATPGTNPLTTPAADEDFKPTALGSGDLGEEVVQQAVRAETAESEVDTLRRELAEMRDMVKNLARNQIVQPMPTVKKLPTMAEVMKAKPSIPTLTEDGYYVPAIHPTDRVAKL